MRIAPVATALVATIFTSRATIENLKRYERCTAIALDR
jgi:hypothetical protein